MNSIKGRVLSFVKVEVQEDENTPKAKDFGIVGEGRKG
jgi:hypothetical protein